MPELRSPFHGNTSSGRSQGHPTMDPPSYTVHGNGISMLRHYPKDYLCRNLPNHPMMGPSLQGLVETEVFVGDEEEEFIEDSHDNSDAYPPSSLVISYQKDPFLQPLNSVKEDIEAEAAEEEISGNYHSLDFLSLGHSSLSSSVVSSTSVDDYQDSPFGLKFSHGPMSLNSISKLHYDDNTTPRHTRHLNSRGHSGKNSPLSKTPLGRGSPRPNSTPEVIHTYSSSYIQSKDQCPSSRSSQSKCTPRCQSQHNDFPRINSEKRSHVWHNPAKSDKILLTEKEGYTLFKRDKENKKNESRTPSDSKFNSLPRKKEKKSDKDIVAETYGTLGRNRHKREIKDSSSKFSRGADHIHDIPRDTKNTLDKYATLPRKRAKEVSAKWRDHLSKESKEKRPVLQRSKSTGRYESQTAKSSPLLTTSLGSTISSRILNSSSKASSTKPDKPKEGGSLSRLFPRRHSSFKEKCDKKSSPSKHLKSSASTKKSVQIQVSIPLDEKEEELHNRIKRLSEDYALLQSRLSVAEANAQEVEELRMEANELRKTVEMEKQEKEELQEELDRTSTRVKNMLTSMEGVEKEFNNRGDSLIDLQCQLQSSTDINVKMQDKLNQSEDFAVNLTKDLDKSMAAQKILLQQVQDLEAEGREMTEFMAEEKDALSECLKEAEAEVGRVRKDCEELSSRLQQKDEEARHMVRLAEERRMEYLCLQSEMCSIQSQTQDIMVCQGAEVSGSSAGLSNLITRLQILTGKLVQDYTISENDIENVVTPVDSDSSISSSTNGTPEQQKSPVRINNRTSSPRKPASFMQSFLNAMKVAQNTSRLLSQSLKVKKEISNTQSLEGRKSPDGSESRTFLDIVPEEGSIDHRPLNSSLTLLDQVTEVDALLTRFLKVCCVLKSDADNILSELEDENERLCNQLQMQQQMIDQQYSNFECLSNFETNARKELKIISKDLEIANETLLKVCDEDRKADFKKLEEELEHIRCTVRGLESMHADKDRKLVSTLQKFTHAHSYDLGAMLLSDSIPRYSRKPNASHRAHPHRPNPKDHRHMASPKCLPLKNVKDDYTNCNSSSFTEINVDDHSTSVNEVDLIINHVLKTLEAIPDVVSSCNILKNLYISLNAQDYLDKTRIAPSPTSHYSASMVDMANGSSSKEEKPIVEEDPPLEKENHIPYDCNANPDPDSFLPSASIESFSSDIDPLTLLPFLTNETAL